MRRRPTPAGEVGPIAGAASSVYVYGVVRSGARHLPAPARLVETDKLAAVVGDVEASWTTAGREDVEAHDRVLGELVQRETVVPLRFGIVMDSDAEVRERLLQRHAPQLEALLQQLDGRVQMSVRAHYLEEALLRRTLTRRPHLKRRAEALEGLPVAGTQPERIALGRDVAEAVQEQRGLDERMIVESLAQAVDDLRVDPPVSDRQAAAVHALVAVERRDALDTAVRQLAAELGHHFAFRYVGPIPPYSFCEISLEEQAWA